MVFVYVVNIEKFQYFNVIGNGLKCQAGFLSDQNPWCVYSINFSRFVALIFQQVTGKREHVIGSSLGHCGGG
jgi:hypothetical protein